MTDIPPAAGQHRLEALDGVRGIAALSVVVFHLFYELFGTRFAVFGLPVFAALTPGNIAVFLMLSGFVLTNGSWRLPQKPRIRQQLVKRYFRLTLPILASVLALLSTGLAWHREAGALLSRPQWLGNKLAFEPSLVGAFYDGTIGVYLPHMLEQAYNPFLWTMQAEFWGSMTLFVILLLDRRLPAYPMLAVAALMFFAVQPVSAAIIIGGLLALLKRDGLLDPCLTSMRRRPLALLSLLGALGIGLPSDPRAEISQTLALVLATLVLLPAIGSPQLQRALSTPLVQGLGRISLPLFMLQFPVLISFTAGAVVWLDRGGNLNAVTAGLVALASLALCIGLAAAARPVDLLSIQLGNRIARLVLRDEPAKLAPMPS